MEDVFRVSIPQTWHDFFDYTAEGLEPTVGARVWVPFRKQTRLGIVIGKDRPQRDDIKIKPIHAIIDQAPILSAEVIDLCHWISTYYHAPLSEVLALVLPKKYRQGDAVEYPMVSYYQLAISPDLAHALVPARATRQKALIDFMASQPSIVNKKALLQAGFDQGVLNKLVSSTILVCNESQDIPRPRWGERAKPLALNMEQLLAVETIKAKWDSYHRVLLQGVTGSGKTEVYLQSISYVLQQGKQALILVPEIGLTPQLLQRFEARFHEPLVVMHSNLSDTERQLAWQMASDNYAKIVIGTRSAVFTPMPTLGLIIIDEEHDASYKQMDGVRYSARDTALVRAQKRNVPIILGSATPSFESLHNVMINKYQRLRLTQKALNNCPLHFRLQDIRNQPLEHGLASPTLQLIEQHLTKGNQVLVFINRRGFSPVFLCHACGWMADCPACDSHFTLHRQVNQNRLICHHCGLVKPVPCQCQRCKGKDLLPIGAGTQRIHDYLTARFPHVTTLRIDRDEVRQKHAMEQHLDQINTGKIQLIVGTQMLAKGHHFPRLTLVVIVDTDNAFYNQDFRALERLGQLFTQVSGRAGRADQPGEVIVQTHFPEHPSLNMLIQQGYEAFANALLQQRQQAKLPPYAHLAIIRAQGKKMTSVLAFLHAIRVPLEQAGLQLSGPAPAPLARKANVHRMQLLLKSFSRNTLHTALDMLPRWLTDNYPRLQGVQWNIDVDPIDLA